MASGDGPHVVVRSAAEAGEVPIAGRLFVGRECAGVDEPHRLLFDDDKVSRQHCEIRIEAAGSAWLFHRLFAELPEPLRRHRGRLSHVAGDAFFAA